MGYAAPFLMVTRCRMGSGPCAPITPATAGVKAMPGFTRQAHALLWASPPTPQLYELVCLLLTPERLGACESAGAHPFLGLLCLGKNRAFLSRGTA